MKLLDEMTAIGVPAGAMPDHLVELPGSDWGLWRCACLRSAGFAAGQMRRLAPPEAIEAAETVLVAEDEEARARTQVLHTINARLDDLRRDGDWECKEKRAPLVTALQALKAGKLPRTVEAEPTIGAAVEMLRAAGERAREASHSFRVAYQSAVVNISSSIRELVNDARFAEAMIWQNRNAYRLVVRALLRGPSEDGARNSKLRQSEEVVATYLQRYCVKNDSIGFFGPIGWASLRPEVSEAISVRPGSELLAKSEVYFEGWGIDVLAEMFADGERRRWAAPRRVPYVRVEGNSIHLPLAPRPTLLPERQASVLRACDGVRTARDIAARLMSSAARLFRTEDEVYQTLEGLEERGLITWTFEVPLAPHPEQQLQKLLDRVEPNSLRQPALEALAEADRARHNVAEAAGDPQRLDEALGWLEETFTRFTGEAPTRGEGQTYAARTLVYTDGRRDVEVEVGAALLDELLPPLSLMLDSARWLTVPLAAGYRRLFEQTYAEMSRRSRSATVDAASFWLTLQPIILDDTRPGPADAVERLFQERWAQILELPRDGQRLAYKSAELLPRVREAFAADQPGWRQARYHSPDVMIVAESTEAIRRGDYQFVLGEMHLASNTLRAALFVAQHPDPQELQRYVAADMSDSLLTMAPPKNWPNLTLRTLPLLTPPRDVYVETTFDSVAPEGSNAIAVSELLIEKRNGELRVCTRDGRQSFDVVDTVGDMLSRVAIDRLRVLPRAAHTPRVTIDRLVICREAWNFPAGEMPFAHVADEVERFLGAQRWARAQGIPRFVFVKVPVEVKPVYVDFGSPIYVDVLSKLVRRTAEAGDTNALVSMSEMLPGSHQTWLTDADGRGYTSELRLVAIDRSTTHSRGRRAAAANTEASWKP